MRLKFSFPSFVVPLVLLASQLSYPQKFIVFDVPGSTETNATAISTSGEIVGNFGIGDARRYGFQREPDGTFTTFNATPDGTTFAWETNPKGEIAGYFLLPTGYWAGFVRDAKGRIKMFSFPGTDTQTLPTDINNRGLIVGAYTEHANDSQHVQTHGFLRSPDGVLATVDINDPYYPNTWISAVNAAGQSVGFYYGEETYPFIRNVDGSITRFGVLNATDTFPDGINGDGIVTGSYVIKNLEVQRGFIRDAAGQVTTFDCTGPTPNWVMVVGIDSKGRVAGNCENTTDYMWHGFVRTTDGVIVKFDAPNAISTFVNNINSRGDIVGQFMDAKGKLHGFAMIQSGSTLPLSPGQ